MALPKWLDAPRSRQPESGALGAIANVFTIGFKLMRHTKTVGPRSLMIQPPSSFLVEDETGEIEILVSEGEMDLRVDRQSESGYGNDAPDQLRNLLTSRYDKDTQWFGFNRTLRYIETYLEPGDKVYVFGQASQADDGRWVMRDGEMPLIVSERSELDVETQTKKDSRFWPTILSAIIAIVAAVSWVVSKS